MQSRRKRRKQAGQQNQERGTSGSQGQASFGREGFVHLWLAIGLWAPRGRSRSAACLSSSEAEASAKEAAIQAFTSPAARDSAAVRPSPGNRKISSTSTMALSTNGG